MNVKMLVRIDMIEGQTGGGILAELRFDLGGRLLANRGAGKDIEAQPEQITAKMATAVDQIRDGTWRQGGAAICKHQM